MNSKMKKNKELSLRIRKKRKKRPNVKFSDKAFIKK